MPAAVVGGIDGLAVNLEVFAGGAEGGSFQIFAEDLVRDADADDCGTSGKVDHEGFEVRENPRQEVGGAVEAVPVFTGAVEADLAVIQDFAVGYFVDPGVDEADEANAAGVGGGLHVYRIVMKSGETSTPTERMPWSSTMRYFLRLPRSLRSFPS